MLKCALAKSGVDSEDLALTDMANCTCLSDLMSDDRKRDIDMHHFVWSGIRQILRRRPNAVPTTELLHRRYSRCKACATPQKSTASTQPGLHKH
jgi:hypothetical protein